ncbi:hypothetical protein K438DRAFT_2027622 [Mycena galopus ATCC 62051]|nr:hypothetical protein K438DRAFT_2027622 [Mycena galopus ATCC 62051]
MCAIVDSSKQAGMRACYDTIWYSDKPVSNDILERLKSAAKELEDVPEDKKDWHPRSNNQVLDLVHLSLYCVIYGRTHAYDFGAVVPVFPVVLLRGITELADPSKTGHRKILAIFLANHTKDPVVSVTDVPPQQADWTAEAFEDACRRPASVLGALPQELRDLVMDYFPETVMTLTEAHAYRLELMKERTANVEAHSGEYVQTFNMCEH